MHENGPDDDNSYTSYSDEERIAAINKMGANAKIT